MINRLTSAAALVLAAFTLLVSVWLFSEIQEQRREAVAGNCASNNKQNRVLDRLLVTSEQERRADGRPLSARARRELRRARRDLRPVSCSRLPVERPVPWH